MPASYANTSLVIDDCMVDLDELTAKESSIQSHRAAAVCFAMLSCYHANSECDKEGD